MHAIRIDEKKRVSLDELSTHPPKSLDKGEANQELAKLEEELGELQELMWGARKHGVLIVLQGRDTAGKDGTIKRVAGALNPRGVQVTSFGVPTEEELQHDFLWRIHAHTPRKGEVSIFNRSHYEDVLITRVHGLITERVWRERYDLINAFEATLANGGTTVIKLFLHISKEEQRKRFDSRLHEPRKRWKFQPADLAERERWDDYQVAYADALAATSTAQSPWYVIPADHKWFRNWAVSSVLVETLGRINPQYPEPVV
jgi:PPK2 family polyphosphate:nucleotide phosphotransferase